MQGFKDVSPYLVIALIILCLGMAYRLHIELETFKYNAEVVATSTPTMAERLSEAVLKSADMLKEGRQDAAWATMIRIEAEKNENAYKKEERLRLDAYNNVVEQLENCEELNCF